MSKEVIFIPELKALQKGTKGVIDSINNDRCVVVYPQNLGTNFVYAHSGLVSEFASPKEYELLKTQKQDVIKVKKKYERIKKSKVFALIMLGHDATCVCCYALTNLTFDHIIPKSKGGSNGLKNGQILCLDCNGAKGDDIISIPELRKRINYGKLKQLAKFEAYNLDLSNFKN